MADKVESKGSARGQVTVARRAPLKPSKPYPGFPLFAHATGRWAKKIKGRFEFFGPWSDPEGALSRYLAFRDWLFVATAPSQRAPTTAAATLTIRELVNDFLNARHRRLESGEMGRRSFSDFHNSGGRLIKALGAETPVAAITPSDFGLLRAALAKTRGPVALGNEIGRVRSVFKHAYEAGLISAPVRFGPEFSKPPKRIMRLARQAKGEMMYEPAEVRALIAAAGVQLKAMILLGINCGLGNSDVAALPITALDLKRGMLEFPRHKTGISRRAVLWPETVEALREAIKARPTPKSKDDDRLVFVTKYGKAWVRVDAPRTVSKSGRQAVVKDAVLLQFGKLVREVGAQKPGRGFYALRHTFRTIADEVGDRRAIDLIMGHEDSADMSTRYVERVSNERLRKVALHVRKWTGIGK